MGRGDGVGAEPTLWAWLSSRAADRARTADPGIGRPSSVRRRMAIRRYLGRLRRQPPRWRAAWTARSTIRKLRRLKSSNPGRPFFGILLAEHIGDIIACQPVIGRLTRLHPYAFLVWVVRPAYKVLRSSHPNLDAFVCVDS